MRLIVALVELSVPVMRALFAVLWAELICRTADPIALRLLLQPLMASAFAIYDGFREARLNRTP
jgi:hypothetical protein